MKVRALCFGVVLMWCSSAAWADVFRCTGADGKTVYQQSPCATGTQKTLDDSKSRYQARQRQLLEAQEREASEELEKHAKLLLACLEDKICEADSYPLFLRGKPRSFVNDVLGDPASVQNIGGQEIHYFNVPTTDGRKSARLQVSYKNFAVDTVNVY